MSYSGSPELSEIRPAAALAVSAAAVRINLAALLPWATVLLVLATLQALVVSQVLPARSFPPVTDIVGSLLEQGRTGEFWRAAGNTLTGWAAGLLIVLATAVPAGVAIGSSRMLYRAVRTVVEFLRPVPSVALIPLAVLIFGVSTESKVFLVAYASFWPMLVQTIYGVQDTDPVAQDTARVFGLTRLQRFALVTLPGATPFIATGLRISSATALILAVTAEIVIGCPGLGAAIEVARSGGAVSTAYALIVATGLLGWSLNRAALELERRVLHWHPSQRREAKI